MEEGDEEDVTALNALTAGAGDSRKSERKRKRERQRRSDLASAFDELSALVMQIYPENDANSDADVSQRGTTSPQRKRGRKKSGENTRPVASSDVDSSGMTRIDLISRTRVTLQRLYRENTDLRRHLESVKRGRNMGDDTVSLLVVENRFVDPFEFSHTFF
jgi:Helix-loop-helix DNA-binding domain